MIFLSKIKKQWNESERKNRDMEFIWEMRLFDIVLNLYKWKNLPNTIDERYMEKSLAIEGNVAFTLEENIGYIALPANYMGYMNVYGNPTMIEMFSTYRNYHLVRKVGMDATFCWNNFTRTQSYPIISIFAHRLADLDRSIDVNAGWQKTPALIRTTKEKELSVRNAIMQIQGNYSVVIGDKSLYEDDMFIDNIDCPFVGDKLSMLRRDIFYEFLTWFGVENSDIQKKERLVSAETTGNDGAIEMSRNTMLNARKTFVKQTNEMFGLNIDVEFNSNLETLVNGYAIGVNKETFKDEEHQDEATKNETSENEN